MKKLSCIIIDDESSAHKVLTNYCANTGLVELRGQFLNARDALAFLAGNRVELIFLDVSMPEIDGFELLRQLDYKPAVIFTTAYGIHAVKSYDYDAVDFLVKPIRMKRFEEAVIKARTLFENKVYYYQQDQFIEVKDKGQALKLNTNAITYLQSIGNYVKIHTKGKSYLLHTTTMEIEKSLDPDRFVRVHKSYIINKACLKQALAGQVELANPPVTLPVGKTYVKFLNEKLK